jgi:hypothetical protein
MERHSTSDWCAPTGILASELIVSTGVVALVVKCAMNTDLITTMAAVDTDTRSVRTGKRRKRTPSTAGRRRRRTNVNVMMVEADSLTNMPVTRAMSATVVMMTMMTNDCCILEIYVKKTITFIEPTHCQPRTAETASK